MSPADALTSVPYQGGLSELDLPILLEEHQVHDEKGSRKKRMRSLSMSATLCCQQKGSNCPPPAPKLARKITYLKSRCLALDSMICNCSSSRSLSSENISSVNYLSFEAPQELNIPNNSSYTQSTGGYREVPHIVNASAIYDIRRDSLLATSKNTFDDIAPEGTPENQRSSLQETSKTRFGDAPPEGTPEIQKSSLQAASKTSFDSVPPEDIPEIKRSSFQVTSKMSFDDVPPEVGVVMDMTKKLTKKTSEKVKMQLDLNASASEEETLSDHYVILRTLGKGNFAEVKLAYHLPTEVQVAIKVLSNGTKNDFGIKTEIDIFKMLNHPYIIKLFHIINTKTTPTW
ncbi:hypothetical protein NN561_010303 [Cricetulus griseus]